MKEYELGFISDKDLLLHVKNTVEKYRFNMNLKEFNKNLIDPIKLSFDTKIYKKDIKDIINNEIMRQIDKSNTNHIGYFHQNIFKYINSEWIVPKEGFDLINHKSNLFVEMKNKHNTMNSASSQKTYIKMQNTILENDKAICMLVEIISKKSQNKDWLITLDKKQYKHNRIRKVSIDKFYEIVTGDKNSFKNLCEKLPKVIEDVVKLQKSEVVSNTVFEELTNISPNILKSLYLLAFENYEGFENFEIEE